MESAQSGVPSRPMFGLGLSELVVLLVVVLLLFGPSRLPQLMESLGKGIQGFRRGLREPPEIDVTPREGETTPRETDTTSRDASSK